jgi:hypothetical protein
MEVRENEGCCAVAEIDHLSEHDNPRDAMMEFCRNLRMYGGGIRHPDSFVIFTGVVGNVARPDYSVSDSGPYDDEHVDDTSYAPNFAKFIRENKLGPVKESVARANKRFHPDHKVRVYVWAPSFKNLSKWWEANKDVR